MLRRKSGFSGGAGTHGWFSASLAGPAGRRPAEHSSWSENHPRAGSSAEADVESGLRDWEVGMYPRHPTVPSESSPPTTSPQDCGAGPCREEWARRRIWQLVNLSSRISGAAAGALSTWSASHLHRLPGCLCSPREGVRANPQPPPVQTLCPSWKRTRKGEGEDQKTIGRRKSSKKVAPPPLSFPWSPLHPRPQSLHQTSRTFSRLAISVYTACMSLLAFSTNDICLRYTKLP